MPLTVALPRERRALERRVALVPAAVTRLLDVPGLAVRIERDSGRSAGFHDAHYEGVEVADDFAATVAGADIVCKVGLPTLAEIEHLAPGTVLVSLTRAFLHLPEIEALARGGVTTVAMDLVPRTARARAMDALSSQATVAGYKAALLAAELSPRLFPMMTTAAGTIRPSRVVVIGAGVAGLQAIATARRLGAEVEAYDIRSRARERIESLGARMIDTGVDGADASGHARALRRDEQQHQHDVLAGHLARAHAVICAASIPNRPAPLIVTRDMVEGMLPDTVIVDMAATTGGNCELTRPGEEVQVGDTLIVGPLNLASHGAVHASEMYARNVVNLLALLVDERGELALDGGDDIVARVVLTHAGEVCHPSTAALMDRPVHPFGNAPPPPVDEDADAESGWASEAPDDLRALAEGHGADARSADGGGSSAASAGAPGDTGVADRSPAKDDRSTDTMRGSTARVRPGAASAADGSGDAVPSAPPMPAASMPDGGASPPLVSGSRPSAPGSDASAPGKSPVAATDRTTDAATTGAGDGAMTSGDAAAARAHADTIDDGARRDDLTVIDGVGPALQERLYAFGVTRLETIAALDEPGRRRLAVQLELDDEIEDGDWAGQARARLADDGPGEESG